MSSYTERLLEMAGQETKRKRRERQIAPAPDPVPTLDDVTFGSPEARALAEERGLTFRDFARSDVIPSGESGYLVDDVRAVLDA